MANHHPKTAKRTSHVDAWAILFIVVLVAGGAVFWAMHH